MYACIESSHRPRPAGRASTLGHLSKIARASEVKRPLHPMIGQFLSPTFFQLRDRFGRMESPARSSW
jgi:hypothetical protein